MNSGSKNLTKHSPVSDRLTAISFAVDELRLYLDTHPYDEEALHLIEDYLNERKKMLGNTAAFSGSLEAYDPNLTNGWDWNDGKLPWEG